MSMLWLSNPFSDIVEATKSSLNPFLNDLDGELYKSLLFEMYDSLTNSFESLEL